MSPVYTGEPQTAQATAGSGFIFDALPGRIDFGKILLLDSIILVLAGGIFATVRRSK